MLVATKLDRVDQRVISENEGKTLAEEHDLLYSETSSKTGHNVKELFEQLICEIHDRGIVAPSYNKTVVRSSPWVLGSESSSSGGKKCC